MAYVGEAAQFQPMNLNVVHVHLIANHVPTVGLVVALSLLLVAFAKKDDELKRITLGVFFVVAASGLFLWFGVVFWGTMLPFLGLRF